MCVHPHEWLCPCENACAALYETEDIYEILHLYSVGDGPNMASEEYPLGSHDNSLSKQLQRSALTG